MTRPSIITTTHMALLAVGYCRQGTREQAERNAVSTAYQLAQLRHPREWGWPAHLVRWLDDCGLSGTGVDRRPGYLELRRLVRLGQVGLVCVSDITRLGRHAGELRSFLADCSAHGVLLAVDGKVRDPRDPTDCLTC
jgi:DNA invertase Pin-like site-specific DNA recombinase